MSTSGSNLATGKGVVKTEEATINAPSNRCLGRSLALIVCFLLSVSNVVIKKSAIAPSTFLMFRGSCQILFFNAVQLATVKHPLRILSHSGNWRVLLTRSVLGAGSIALTFFCLQTIPLSIYAVIYELSPLFTVIISAIVLKECIKPLQMLLGAVALVGAVLVIQPPIGLFEKSGFHSRFSGAQYWMMIFAFFIPLGVATSLVLLRKLGKSSVPVPASLCTQATAVGCLLIGLLLHFISRGFSGYSCPTIVEVIIYVSLTAQSCLNQVLIYYANKFEKSPVVSLILSAKVAFLFIADFLLFPEQTDKYNVLHYIGGSAIVASILTLMLMNNWGTLMAKNSKNKAAEIAPQDEQSL